MLKKAIKNVACNYKIGLSALITSFMFIAMFGLAITAPFFIVKFLYTYTRLGHYSSLLVVTYFGLVMINGFIFYFVTCVMEEYEKLRDSGRSRS